MDYADATLQFTDFVSQSSCNSEYIKAILSDRLNTPMLWYSRITNRGSNTWVWLPDFKNFSIVSAVYSFINNKDMAEYNWKGWKIPGG